MLALIQYIFVKVSPTLLGIFSATRRMKEKTAFLPKSFVTTLSEWWLSLNRGHDTFVN